MWKCEDGSPFTPQTSCLYFNFIYFLSGTSKRQNQDLWTSSEGSLGCLRKSQTWWKSHLCVFCVASPWATELMGARRSGAAANKWSFGNRSPLPVPQPPVPQEFPISAWGRAWDKASSIRASFKALILRGLGGGGDFFQNKTKKVDGFLLWRWLNSP